MARDLLVDGDDVRFTLFDLIGVERLLELDAFKEFDRDTFISTIDLAAELAAGEMLPANVLGDRQAATFDAANSAVKAPPAFHPAWKAYCEAGFPSLSLSQEIGGIGVPDSIWKACSEYLIGANVSMSLYAMLTVGAIKILHRYGNDTMRNHWIPKMLEGEWSGTMCLTEPVAGSDVGALRTKAIPQDDGTYRIVGQKIWISSGDHDLCGNIIHTVLARVEGDPDGTKGISIFAVPKHLTDENGNITKRNDVFCAGVEHKMGIKGSATCTMQYGDKGECVGYLLGELRQGMSIMFEMMNDARIEVAVQGLALSSTAYRHAAKYAAERVQGGDPLQPGKRVSIINHADVRRMLLRLKSYTEAMRSLTYFGAYFIDLAHHSSGEEKSNAQNLVDFFIPVLKASNTDLVWEMTAEAIQIYGGYGFCSEYPMEQMARDCKIFSIYEGTNGIQSMDLLMRKILLNKDQECLKAFGGFVEKNIKELPSTLNNYGQEIGARLQRLVAAVTKIGGDLQAKKMHHVLAKAVPLQHSVRYISFALMHAMALGKLEKCDASPYKKDYVASRRQSARYFLDYEFGFVDQYLSQIENDANVIAECPVESFA